MRALAVAACTCLLAVAAGCTHTPAKIELYQALSAPAKADYDKYRQFLTEGQQDRYLALPNDQERTEFLATLHIEERLARFPKYVQTAIWDRDAVPGMDTEALLLSWGRPDAIERAPSEESKGVDQQIWLYGHGKKKEDRVTVIQNVVTVVDKSLQ